MDEPLTPDDKPPEWFEDLIGRLKYLIGYSTIESDGATLRHVSDNFRSLMVCLAISVVLTQVWRGDDSVLSRILLVAVWGAWLLPYTAITCLQSAILFVIGSARTMAWLHDHTALRRPIAWIGGKDSRLNLFIGAVFLCVMVIFTGGLEMMAVAVNKAFSERPNVGDVQCGVVQPGVGR